MDNNVHKVKDWNEVLQKLGNMKNNCIRSGDSFLTLDNGKIFRLTLKNGEFQLTGQIPSKAGQERVEAL